MIGLAFSLESPSPERTQDLGRRLGSLLGPGDLVALVGPLGAGKTCLAQGVLSGLGVAGPAPSPSFVLIREHRGRLPAYHFDAFRLEGPQDLQDLGYEEYFYGPGVVLVEWADRVAELLPPDHLWVELELLPERERARRVTFSARGPRSQRILEELKRICW
ncbi:MAG: tRNA (adenosine(37)-N6)-threonylcarbamoyltransferase complex ATPase subunit type 1 TsaE [Acetobacteraceae bacterium]|nr:tRNA (adenosine(37)-N6)-threonylcarbamoyltransferase complex ATPase subunit type 1 TsaE [Acetobacteraceae bacterium]